LLSTCRFTTSKDCIAPSVYITPKDMLAGRRQQIHAERDRKLEQARKQREEIGRLRSNPVQENAA
jgi:hypothetical protein